MIPHISSIEINIYEESIKNKPTYMFNNMDKKSFFSQYPFLDFLLSLIIIFINILYIINGVIGLIFFRIGDIIELFNSNLGQFLQWISLFISTIGLIIFVL